jgi:Fe-S cluster assembly ATPase SufC
VKDQNIILLLGDTGTGKSTTIHFLAGSKMHQTKRGNISHIEPKEITNKFL